MSKGSRTYYACIVFLPKISLICSNVVPSVAIASLPLTFLFTMVGGWRAIYVLDLDMQCLQRVSVNFCWLLYLYMVSQMTLKLSVFTPKDE